MRLPLHTGGSGAWLYDADDKYLADFTHSKYTCEQIRQNAADVVAMSHELDRLRAANARLQAWHDAVMGQETIGFEIVFKTGKWLKYDPSGFAPETKSELIIRPQPLAKE